MQRFLGTIFRPLDALTVATFAPIAQTLIKLGSGRYNRTSEGLMDLLSGSIMLTAGAGALIVGSALKQIDSLSQR